MNLTESMLQAINEKEEYQVYHNSYLSAIDAVVPYAKKRGFDIDEGDITRSYQDAFFKPKEGKTKKDSFEIFKKGKKQKKQLQVQIYNRGDDKFELNMYIN